MWGDNRPDPSQKALDMIGDVDVGNYTVTAADHVTAAIENTEDFKNLHKFKIIVYFIQFI